MQLDIEETRARPSSEHSEIGDATSRVAFYSALKAVLSGEPSIAVVHNSLSSLLAERSFGRFDALYALNRLAREGWTFAIPAFTFSFCRGKTYSYRNSPSEVGLLADWALSGLPTARRTAHPIYSFVVFGPSAADILACTGETTFGRGSTFEFFEANRATIVMLGCGWNYCTPFHRYEELAKVPYRYMKTFTGEGDFGTGSAQVTAQMYVRDLQADPRNDFMPAVKELRRRGAIKTAKLWRGVVESVAMNHLAEVCREQLKADGYAHVSNGPAVSQSFAARRARERQGPLKVAVLGSSNVEILRAALEGEVAAHVQDRTVETFSVPYGQMQRALIDPSVGLLGFGAEYTLFADRLEDVAATVSIDGIDAGLLHDRVADYADAIVHYRQQARGWIFVARFAALRATGESSTTQARLIAEMNGILEAALQGVDQIAWIDMAQQAALSKGRVTDDRLWHLGRFPFTEPFSQQLAKHVTGLVLAAMGKTARVLVVDLDNTMWGGVLGEDGIDGVKIAGDYPGNAFLAFQKALRTLARRGIAIAIASKNDTDLALKMIDEHPGMEIRSTDIVTHRINWSPKFSNIQEICDELSLGLESALFIDDNPVEREGVKRNLPAVKVLDLPPDPAEYAETLLSSPWLGVISVTAEDLKRVESYKNRAKIEQSRKTAVSLEDFYKSLGMTLHMKPVDATNIARAAQLCKKTNQFNTTTRRYEAADLTAIAAAGGDVAVIALEDKYSGEENIGLIIVKDHPDREAAGLIDLYLMSCRVLGRGLETAITRWAMTRGTRRGWRELRGPIIETERNTPVRGVYRDTGFAYEEASGEWVAACSPDVALPSYLTIADHMPTSSR
ncbi:HAD-IIIC family phosphatase [Sinorhizobium sp. RAC02]|uniref:HAD-IIIC family phosphatase n=1 Tax=Sinorhizobium sp. RAC02 TaxID=1842534 RepID=UPI0008554548|nr:HAD-IIIC family phosphatase [Sinorhizobium sp. RAC02]AOF92757.1 HAD phosphatase, family IIIC domain protein [Sinorhizobium sp. RAC02]